jgi:hypothetical protein
MSGATGCGPTRECWWRPSSPPMDEEVAALAEAISERADRHGDDALGKLTGLMLEARGHVLVSMNLGWQQIGAGRTDSGSGASGCRG